MEDKFHLGIKALIRNKKRRVLVLKANLKTFVGTMPEHWDLPGGRVQRGENNIEDTLRREVKEEINIDNIAIVKLLDASIFKTRISYEDIGLILFTYLCEIDEDQKIELTDNEHVEYRWCSPEEAAELLKTKFAESLIEKIKTL